MLRICRPLLGSRRAAVRGLAAREKEERMREGGAFSEGMEIFFWGGWLSLRERNHMEKIFRGGRAFVGLFGGGKIRGEGGTELEGE